MLSFHKSFDLFLTTRRGGLVYVPYYWWLVCDFQVVSRANGYQKILRDADNKFCLI